MGKLSKMEFGRSALPPRAFLFGGPANRDKIDRIIGSYDEVMCHRHDVCERYLVRENNSEAVIIFQLYGAPIMCDLVTVLADGKVKELFFLGSAYGYDETLQIGDCVIPNEVQVLDGVTTCLGANADVAPDLELRAILERSMDTISLPFRTGKSVSVPATFWHGAEKRIDPAVLALELELASLCYCARELGMKAAGLLVISDTREQRLVDKRPSIDSIMIVAFQSLRQSSDRP